MFQEQEKLVAARIKRGEVVLVLGAGANAGSTNRRKEPIPFGPQLAKKIAEEMGEEFNGEPLADVASAASHIIGKEALNQILVREFRYCEPSSILGDLFNYTWSRIYTWNYDDALEMASKSSVQRCYYYNGMHASVEEIDRRANLQSIFLHGKITELDRGLILSKEEYAKTLQSDHHGWYKELAADYKASLIIFIGSSLHEPILEAEVQRASQPENDLGGYKFVITPDNLSGIQKASLAARKIIHTRGTLSDFVTWLKSNIGPRLQPKDLIQDQKFFTDDNLDRFKQEDIETAQHLLPIQKSNLSQAFEANSSLRQEAIGRMFLLGFPINWQIAASDIPVKLKQTSHLTAEIKRASEENRPLFVTVGQAGSGKSTATMQALLEISTEGEIDVFELDASVKSVSAAVNVLKRISDKPKLVFLRNLFVFGNRLADTFPDARKANVTFVATSRSSEWQEHFRRHFESDSETFTYQRFEEDDYAPLINQLVRFVPAPSFVKLPKERQLDALRRSKAQLLIALREVTESRQFEDIIRDEYRSLDNRDVQDLFLIVGMATLARVGVDPARAAEAYQRKKRGVSFKDAMERLQGIVEPAQGGRLFARHEFYVRNILDTEAAIAEVVDSISALLHTFTKFAIPITAHVTRTDGALFRFLLNHSVLRERAERAGDKERGLEVYRDFELAFQLDGHFWLQYGLYYQKLGQISNALEMLEKSIQAFPGNPFAQHALASLQLKQAANRVSYDDETRRLIRLAVRSLEELDRTDNLFFDQYPLVTLSRYHVGALIRHNRRTDAIPLAKEYFERLKVLEKKSATDEITEEKVRMLTLATTGDWKRPSFNDK